MEAVRLAWTVRADMISHAREAAPRECCGLLIGEGLSIDASIRSRNLDANPRARYLLDPAAHIDANRRLRGTGRRVVGCYHSHPRSQAVPSPSDRAEACYPEFIWVIVSLRGPEPEVAAYRLGEGTAVFLPIEPARDATRLRKEPP